MRTKDDDKREALFQATVELVNKNGFAASSVSKIARKAGVSPATLYVYYKNKEDLLVSTYIEIKRDLSRALLEDFDKDQPIRDILKNIWYRMFKHISGHKEYFRYTEQFANSPYSALVDAEQVEHYFEPVIEVLNRGIEQKIIKNVNFDILTAFVFYPIVVLANPNVCKRIELNETTIETAFAMAWDAIRL